MILLSAHRWQPATHMGRVTTMAEVFASPGSTMQNDTKLLSATLCAFETWFKMDLKCPNWLVCHMQ